MIDLNSLQAITFDAAGTLLEPSPSVGAIYARVAEECGIGPVSVDALNRQFGQAWKAKKNFDYSRCAWWRIVDQTFSGLAHTKPHFFDHLYDEFALPHCWRVHDDVGPALERCRGRGLKLGIISNWDQRLRPLLGQIGLAPYFDAIVVSLEVGHHKPEPEIFRHAAELLQVPAEHILHVGDSVEEDLRGATTAGFKAMLLDRNGSQPPAIRTLAALIPD